MKLSNWQKLIWWLILVAALTYFLWARLPDLLSGKAAVSDIAVFGVWMALLLAPLFSEVSLLGVTLKNEIQELKDHVTTQIAVARAEIRNAVDVQTIVSATVNVPPPVSDSLLPEITAHVKAAVAAALAERGRDSATPEPNISVPEDVKFLFATRFHIEFELRRIAAGRMIEFVPKIVNSIPGMSKVLVDAGLLTPQLGRAIWEVSAVCMPAIHGAPISAAKAAFVRDVAPELVSALRAIK